MATSTCPKCDSTKFEMKENSPADSIYKIMFIQCASCGAVVGTTDFFNVPDLVRKLALQLGKSV